MNMYDDHDGMIIDVVYCIDGTRSMGSDDIRNGIRLLTGENDTEFSPLHGAGRVARLRSRVIVFRDFRSCRREGLAPLEASGFFDNPGDLKRFLEGIDYSGGGDTPENALEAFYCAMCSEWTPPAEENLRRIRQVIVIITDSVAFHPSMSLRRGVRSADDYPKGMPKTLDGLKKLWQNGSDSIPLFTPACARLVIVGPHTDVGRAAGVLDWIKVSDMDRTWFVPVAFFDGKMNLTQETLSDIRQAAGMIRAVHPDQEE